MDESNYLQQLFINEAKPALQRHSGGGGGLPEGGEPHKQLVTDADGNTAWEDKLCYTEHFQGEFLPETEMTLMEETSFYMCTEPLTNQPFLGGNYTVIINGVTFNCVAKETASGDMPMITLGNASIFGGEYSEDPFFIAFAPEEAAEEMGGITVMCVPFFDVESVTLSITGEGEHVKQIDNKYLDVKDEIYIVDMHTVQNSDSSPPVTNSTLDEIIAAHKDGKIVFCRITNVAYNRSVFFPLANISLNRATFSGFNEGDSYILDYPPWVRRFVNIHIFNDNSTNVEVLYPELCIAGGDGYEYTISVDDSGNVIAEKGSPIIY